MALPVYASQKSRKDSRAVTRSAVTVPDFIRTENGDNDRRQADRSAERRTHPEGDRWSGSHGARSLARGRAARQTEGRVLSRDGRDRYPAPWRCASASRPTADRRPDAAIAGAVSGRMRPDASVIARPSDHVDRLAQHVGSHVVQQHRVDAERPSPPEVAPAYRPRARSSPGGRRRRARAPPPAARRRRWRRGCP